jgi:protein-tyrosine phosphatase
MNIVTREFANHRGLIRTVLADCMWRMGPYRKYGRVDWRNVERLVFVCQGNICRSPFAHHLAKVSGTELPVASFGLATTTGGTADSVAIDAAGDFGLDMSEHRATDLTDFAIRNGDLLLVMEDRHISWISPYLAQKDVQVRLLGLWCRPRFALLYDPHGHPRDYFLSCFDRINRAVANLLQEHRDYSRTQ